MTPQQEIEKTLTKFIEHFLMHLETYKKWSPEQIAKTAMNTFTFLPKENKLKVADLRDLEKQVLLGEISYSRMVEIINERLSLPTPEQGIAEKCK